MPACLTSVRQLVAQWVPVRMPARLTSARRPCPAFGAGPDAGRALTSARHLLRIRCWTGRAALINHGTPVGALPDSAWTRPSAGGWSVAGVRAVACWNRPTCAGPLVPRWVLGRACRTDQPRHAGWLAAWLGVDSAVGAGLISGWHPGSRNW